MENKTKIPVFVINLEERKDRKAHTVEQFRNKPEFSMNIVKAIQDKIGAIGLWKTMKKIVKKAQDNRNEYIILCEDDHLFTENYNEKKLFELIQKGKKLHADLLLGGVSHFVDAVEFDKGLFWLSSFTGFQFAIIYNHFFNKFLSIELNNNDNIDIKMKDISDKIFCIYPFISIQKEFEYSDVTKRNELTGVVTEYFVKSDQRLKTLSFLKKYFSQFHNQ